MPDASAVKAAVRFARRIGLIDRSPDARFAGNAKPLATRVVTIADPATLDKPSLLVRPNGVVVWASGQDPETPGTDLAAALQRWAGSR